MLYTAVNRRTENKPVDFRMGKTEQRVKRALDILFSLCGIVVTFPIGLLIIIALSIQGKGPIFFSQERIGLNGKAFNILKFRTMDIDAEANGPQLEQDNDPRLTPVGKFLRVHHLDELPQLINVLVGDMSMVGPRPERQYFIDQIMQEDSRYTSLFKIRPGVTSEATLYNGYTNTMEKMLERLNMDLHYMETATIWTDLKILINTVGRIICGEK